jgi:23S rRNA-/tRNA-specific pseudouridylate synthase
VVERYGDAAALLEFDIYTGRKHQVRVHAVEGLGSPVLMDTLYSSKGQNENDDIRPLLPTYDSKKQFFLHASSLEIPEYGINVKASLPYWWDETISALQKS